MADGEATLRRRKALRRGSAAEYIAAAYYYSNFHSEAMYRLDLSRYRFSNLGVNAVTLRTH